MAAAEVSSPSAKIATEADVLAGASTRFMQTSALKAGAGSVGGGSVTGRDVTVGIVNYNGATYLPDTLAAVGRLGSRVSEVLLVDNASVDGSVTLARQLCPEPRVVVLESNRGPGAARNEILRRASYERILMIDDDVSPEVGCRKSFQPPSMKTRAR